jgi:hypothetical protein
MAAPSRRSSPENPTMDGPSGYASHRTAQADLPHTALQLMVLPFTRIGRLAHGRLREDPSLAGLL